MDCEGIYRLSGNKTRIQKLILAFDQGRCYNFQGGIKVFAYKE